MDLTKRFITICGLKINTVQIPEIVDFIEERIRARKPASYIVTTNANTIVLGKRDPAVRQAVNGGDLSIADGYSLVFFSRFYGSPLQKRAYGPDLMSGFLKVSEEKGYSNFFYGSTDNTLKALAEKMKTRFPRLKIAGYYSPPFGSSVRPDEKEIDIINRASADVVWVGLGGVKQEKWMYENRARLNVPVLIGVGAAFDFLSGVKPQAPLWMRESGFEWLFRLLSEPKRLWRRYLVNNTLFVWYVSAELMRRGVFSCRRARGSTQGQNV